MHVTHLGHATLLIETADQRILIDPGTFTPDWETLTDLDIILVTHAHPDHFDPSRFGQLMAGNPNVWLGCDSELASNAAAPYSPDPLKRGDSTTKGAISIEVTGGKHAIIHKDITCISNVGFVISDGDRSLYHPGDALDKPVKDVDLLAVPIHAPWCAMKETVDFVKACSPRYFAPIHDALLSKIGRDLYVRQVNNLTGQTIQLCDLAGRGKVAL